MQALRSQERRREDRLTGPHAFLVAGRTLVLTLTGVRVLMPVTLVYNAYQYTVFRGKVRSSGYG
jgi:cytochrome bd-type quinol oxidase subunit 2